MLGGVKLAEIWSYKARKTNGVFVSVCTAVCTCSSFSVCITLDVVCCILRFAAPVTDVPSFLSCLCGLMCSTALLSRPALPLPDPPLALARLPLAQPDPPQPLLTLTSLARLCSALLIQIGLASAEQLLPRGGWDGWTLGPADIWALTAISLSWLSLWKSPFFFLVFLLWLSLLLLCNLHPPCLSP